MYREIVINAKTGKEEFIERELTSEEIEQINNNKVILDKQQEIAELLKKLKKYDYIGTKIATGRATKEQYATEISQMTKWANEVDKLEKELEVLNGN